MQLGRNDDAYEVLSGVIERIGLEWDYPRLPDMMAVVLADWLEQLHLKGLVAQGEEVADVVLRRYQGETPTQRIAIVGR